MSLPTPLPTPRPTPFGGCRVVVLLAAMVLAAGSLAQEAPPASAVFDAKTVAGKVADFAPLGAADTPDGKALAALVLHGRHFAPETLAAKAGEFPTDDQLKKSDGDPNSIAKPELRFQLVKFTARLSRVTRLAAPPDVKPGGIADLYEVKLFPSDRLDPAFVVVSALPANVSVGEQPPTAPRVVVAGYFLKVVRYRDGDVLTGLLAADHFAPLFVAPAFTISTPKSKFDFDGDRAVYAGIRDFVSLRDGDRFAEGTAYEDLVRHARLFDTRELTAAAEELPLAELLRRKMASVPSTVPGMPPEQRLRMEREDFRFKLLKVTGQLKRVVRIPVPKDLAEAGVTDLYEAWIFSSDRTEPVCVVVAELPDGVSPAQEVKPSRTVTAAGYFLKVIRYESGETAANNKAQGRFAPLLIGRSFVFAAPPDLDGGHNWRTVFLPAILLGLGLLTVLFLGLTWWFKSTDRASRKAVEARRVNPFDDPASPVPDPPAG